MFGYVRAAVNDLSEAEKRRYRAVYCGLCHVLGRRHGVSSRFSLTYDMTFLILFLSSLYEPEESCGQGRCAVHPLKENAYVINEMTEYAADITVALMYHKCMDDWRDDHKFSCRGYASLLKNSYCKVRERWPSAVSAIEWCMREISAIEADPAAGPDAAANSFGTMLGQIFLFATDEWQGLVKCFGWNLGRFIYTMDAVIDCGEDQKRGHYNPVLLLGRSAPEMQELLMLQIGQAAEAFEHLPLVQDVHLMRNILYSGVWQSYNRMLSQKGEANE